MIQKIRSQATLWHGVALATKFMKQMAAGMTKMTLTSGLCVKSALMLFEKSSPCDFRFNGYKKIDWFDFDLIRYRIMFYSRFAVYIFLKVKITIYCTNLFVAKKCDA